MKIEMNLNGEDKIFEIDPSETLLDMLRREGYKGTKRGCSKGHCGTCTVLVDGKAVKSCVYFAAQAHKRKVTTIEGIGTPDNPHPLHKHFVDKGAVQCGYCIPGMLLSAKALIDENPTPNDEDVREAIDGNLCRCTGYVKQAEAILAAAEEMRGGK